jgi:hypothetical protein
VVAAVLHAGGEQEPEVTRVETLGDRLVRLGYAEPGESYRPIVHHVPGQDAVRIVTLRYDAESDLTADIYYPPGASPAAADGWAAAAGTGRRNAAAGSDAAAPNRFPVLLFPVGFVAGGVASTDGPTPKEMRHALGFLPIYAMHGIVGVIYDTDDLRGGFDRLLAFLERHEEKLRLDLSRLGIWATSGHGRFASRMMSVPDLVDRVMVCIFIHADANPTVLPPNVAFFVAYSRDGSTIERYSATLVRRARARGHTCMAIDDVSRKNFFYEDDTAASRDVIERSAVFAAEQLGADGHGGKTEERQ